MECGKGIRMSDMIQFVAQLMVDVGRRDSQIQRALQVLQRAQPHDPVAAGEMQPLTHGDWIDIRDVVKAIRILDGGQEGQK